MRYLPPGWYHILMQLFIRPCLILPVVFLFCTSAVEARGGIDEYGTNQAVLLDAPLNHAPVAVDDTVYLKPGESVAFDVLANDSDSDGDLLVAGFGTSPALGTVSFDGINLTYTAGPKFRTNDSFTYILSDGKDGTSTATVTLRNRFLNGRGAFTPVLLADGQPAGTLRLNVTSTGAVSGSIQIGKSRSAIHGSFDFNGEFTQLVNLAGVIVAVTVLSDPISGRLAGTVKGTNVNFSFSNEAMLAGKAVGNAPVGRYTMMLPAPEAAVPRGTGWAAMLLGKNGSARFAGRLGDGAAFSASSRLRVDASLWLDVGGALFGTLTFENLPESDFHGSLKWKYLPAMHTEIAAAGARDAGVPYFRFSQTDALTADLRSVESAAINEAIGFGGKGKPFILNSSTGLSFSINRSTGLFTGKFPKETARRRSFSGVIFQKKNSGYGIYTESVPGGRGVWQIDQAATDSVTLVPR
ncbi:MAG: hypothetical protein JWL59_752 [Chthoniobacteraceae bacterium]|nr:hypothetical protein [Chthoniobacteraceae bacterium]